MQGYVQSSYNGTRNTIDTKIESVTSDGGSSRDMTVPVDGNNTGLNDNDGDE